MIQKLEGLARELALRDTESRSIVQAYTVFEVDRREPMYAELEKRMPSLRYIIDESRKKKNLLDVLSEARQGAVQLNGSILVMRMLGCPDSLVNQMKSTKQLIEHYCNFEEDYLLAVANEAKGIAKESNTSPIEVVSSLELLDKVHRCIFSDRKDAETHIDTRINAIKEMVLIARRILGHTKQESELNKMPTEHALEQYGLASKAFEAGEFDRIYK